MPVTIPQLNQWTGLPTGNELFELSNNPGSFKIAMAILASARQENTVSAAGTFNVSASNYGDVIVTSTGAVTVNLPDATARQGVPVSVIGYSLSPNVTIVPAGLDTIMSLASLALTTAFGAYTLWPRAGGWYQK